MDYLRGLAIVLVLSVHVSQVFTGMNTITFLTYLYISIEAFSQVSVPLFIFISGFVLFLKYQSNFSIITFYKTRFLSIVPQYLVFSTLYTVFFMGLLYLNIPYSNGPVTFSINSVIENYLSGGAALQLWFFVLIIQLYILYPLLALFCKTIFPSKIKTAIFLFILFLIPYLYRNELFILHSFDNNSIFYFFWNTVLIFSRYLFYFVMGMYISLKYNDFKDFIHKISFKRFLIPLVFFNILGIIFYIESEIKGKIQFNGSPSIMSIGFQVFSFFEPVFYFLIFLILFHLVLNMNRTGLFCQCLKKIGDLSFGIFLIEVFFLTLLPVILEIGNITFDNYLYYPLVLSLNLLLSISSLLLIRKIPFSQYIIGKVRD
jgi:peptidoglycan/LPS O-acetylase OafA/YrhL